MNSAVDAQLLFEHVATKMVITVTGPTDETIEPTRQQIENGRLILIQLPSQGDVFVSLSNV